MQVRACAGERGERAGVGPPLRVRVLVTSRLALLSCPIMTLMPSLNIHPRTMPSAQGILPVKQSSSRRYSRLVLVAELQIAGVPFLAEVLVEQLARALRSRLPESLVRLLAPLEA